MRPSIIRDLPERQAAGLYAFDDAVEFGGGFGGLHHVVVHQHDELAGASRVDGGFMMYSYVEMVGRSTPGREDKPKVGDRRRGLAGFELRGAKHGRR